MSHRCFGPEQRSSYALTDVKQDDGVLSGLYREVVGDFVVSKNASAGYIAPESRADGPAGCALSANIVISDVQFRQSPEFTNLTSCHAQRALVPRGHRSQETEMHRNISPLTASRGALQAPPSYRTLAQ